MGKEDEKDIMSDVINDISSAAEEANEEAPDTAEEAAQVFAEAAEAEEEEEITPADAETIVVKFDDEIDAARAVRVLNKALRTQHETIYQGAVISRDEDDEELQVEDLRDMGLADVITFLATGDPGPAANVAPLADLSRTATVASIAPLISTSEVKTAGF